MIKYNKKFEDIKEEIIQDIKLECDHYSECGYDNWHNFLSDSYMMDEDYEEVIHTFTEEELEKIWRDSHSIIFKNEEHKNSYEKFKLKAKISKSDTERKSLFYLLALLPDTRNNINDLYDFKENMIKLEGINKCWQTGGSTKITKLAFNLYNGWKGEDGEDYSPLHLFSVADDNREYLLEAIRIRFS